MTARLLPVLLALVLAACPSWAQDMKPATLLPQWSPQAQFAGWYAAEELGFFAEEGVDMAILRGGPDQPVSDFLEDGRAVFGTMFLSTAVEAQSRGLDLVNVAQVAQRSALMLVARADSGIETARDLDGRKVGLWPDEFQIQPRALFRQLGIHVTIVPQTSSMTLFLRGAVPAATVMWYNEYHTLLASGLDEKDIRAFFFHEMEGLNFPEDGIYCLRSTLTSDPELVRAVVAAGLRGWLWVFDHPDEALDLVLKRMAEAHVPASRVHQRWMLQRMKDIILVEGSELGGLERDTYNQVVQTLFDMGFITSAPMFETFFKGKIGGVAHAP